MYSYQALKELREASPAMEALAKALATEAREAPENSILGRARSRAQGYAKGLTMAPPTFLGMGSRVFQDRIQPYFGNYAQITICALAQCLLDGPEPVLFRDCPDPDWDYLVDLPNQVSVARMRRGWAYTALNPVLPEWEFLVPMGEEQITAIFSAWNLYRATCISWKLENTALSVA